MSEKKLGKILRDPRISWWKDNTLGDVEKETLEAWPLFLNQVLGCKEKQEDLDKVFVPGVPHLYSELRRQGLRRSLAYLPASITLKKIWNVVRHLPGLIVEGDQQFLNMVEATEKGDGDRRFREIYIVRFSSKGNELDRLKGSVDEVQKKKIATMRISEMLMFIAFHCYMKGSIPRTIEQATVFPESEYSTLLSRRYPCMDFHPGTPTEGEQSKDDGVLSPLSISQGLHEIQKPKLKIHMERPESVASGYFRCRQVIVKGGYRKKSV